MTFPAVILNRFSYLFLKGHLSQIEALIIHSVDIFEFSQPKMIFDSHSFPVSSTARNQFHFINSPHTRGKIAHGSSSGGLLRSILAQSAASRR
jgi:hypothetical protein